MRKMNFRTDRRFSESQRKLRENSYGWSIKYDCVDDALDTVKDVLGVEGLLDNLVMAMSTDELRENLEYICRMQDITGDFLEGYPEDYDEE